MTDINTFQPFRAGTHSTFSCTENNCTYIGKNPNDKEIRQYKIDGEVFPKNSSPLRCDYLFLNDTNRVAYYVELKGTDIFHAIEQIQQTEKEIQPSIREYAVYRRIIYYSRSHRVNDQRVQKWKLQGKGANVLKERKHEDTY